MNARKWCWIAVLAAAAATALLTDAPAAKKPAPPPKDPVLTLNKPFACADYGGNKVCLVDKTGKITWQISASRPQDVWVLPNGNILFAYLRGVKEVTRDKKVVGVIDDWKQFSTISGVFVMDTGGDPTKFEITR